MSKMGKAIAVLGVVAGLGVAALPLASYAVDPASDKENVTITATVKGAIDLTVDKNVSVTTTLGADVEAMVGGQKNGIGSVVAKVSTNSPDGYTLNIEDADTNTSLMEWDATTNDFVPDTDSPASIPALVAGAGINDDSAWAVRASNTGAKTVVTSWTAVAAKDTKTSLVVTEGTASDDETTIEFGVHAKADQKPGVYKDTVILTAVANS